MPSSCSTTMTSIAPDNVAGLIEFHVLETPLPRLRTYCIVYKQRKYHTPPEDAVGRKGALEHDETVPDVLNDDAAPDIWCVVDRIANEGVNMK